MSGGERLERELDLHETHLSIRTTIRWIGADLERPVGPAGQELGVSALLELLRIFRDELVRHFQLEEQGTPPYAVASSPDERAHWVAEHRALARELEVIVSGLGRRAEELDADVPDDVVQGLREFFARLAAHEGSESGGPARGAASPATD